MRIGIVVGEKSGDELGAGLIQELKKTYPQIKFEGILGPKLIKLGGEEWASSEELSMMGIFEPLKALPRLLLLRRDIIKRWVDSPPDVFIGVDAPEFNIDLEIQLKKIGIKTLHYVSPSIWAWRKNRIKKIKKAVDRILCILPFEESIYRHHNISAKYVGHPLAESMPHQLKKIDMRKKFNISANNLIAVLPGSRKNEVLRLGSFFVKTAKLFTKNQDDIFFIAPMASGDLSIEFKKIIDKECMNEHFLVIEGNSHECMIASDVVLASSGTSVLEAALLSRPAVAAYKVSSLSYFFLNILVKTKYFTLPNILLDDQIIPEYIQNNLDEHKLYKAIFNILNNQEYSDYITPKYTRIREMLSRNANRLAAAEVLKLYGK
tara:strand:- start:42 stop:1172 length:1131 start_codon:yes stop_codon:yes gene_type:complete